MVSFPAQLKLAGSCWQCTKSLEDAGTLIKIGPLIAAAIACCHSVLSKTRLPPETAGK